MSMPISLPAPTAQEIAATDCCCMLSSQTAIDLPRIRDSQELLCPQRLDIGSVSCLNMPGVERIILGDMSDLMKADPSPEFGRAAPFDVSNLDRLACHALQGSIYA
ncbi:hypothetical protein [Rhizobium lusitanum]|uniref:Uncharacterized protein n=1 Tax=Rhizobium lusitanum TaxID=293958 RepID=A0A7X0MC08_9HYPH|nr:hypothetical protein [Rhizobium lusitanum]MBB6483458.1 hypothetical protein [Rhizobium lusitanum]